MSEDEKTIYPGSQAETNEGGFHAPTDPHSGDGLVDRQHNSGQAGVRSRATRDGVELQQAQSQRDSESNTGSDGLPLTLWQRALNASGSGIVITNPHQPDNPIIYCNPAFESLSGYPAREVIGRNCRFLQGPETDKSTVERIRQAIQLEHGIVETLYNYRKDGTAFWNRLIVSPVRNEAGQTTHFVGAQLDISDSIAAEEERSKRLFAEDIVNTIREPLVILEADFRVKTANRAFYKVFKMQAEETEGRHIYTLGGGQWNLPRLKEVLERILPFNNPLEDFRLDYASPATGPLTLLINARKLEREGRRPEYILLAMEDVTRREADAQTLRVQKDDIGALNEKLQRAMTETHHRVKNNLQIIASMNDMLLMEAASTVPVAGVKRVSQQVRALAVLHDLLTREAKHDPLASRVGSEDLLLKLVALLSQTATTHTFETHIENVSLTPRQATGLSLVANELINNAVKHGKRAVFLSFQRLQKESAAAEGESDSSTNSAGIAQLHVEDDGPGFPPGFDPLQAANTGLELVEGLARYDLGGTTRYETRPEGGGRVSVEFPLDS